MYLDFHKYCLLYYLISEIKDQELKNKDYNSSEVQKMQTTLKMLGMKISVDGDF